MSKKTKGPSTNEGELYLGIVQNSTILYSEKMQTNWSEIWCYLKLDVYCF